MIILIITSVCIFFQAIRGVPDSINLFFIINKIKKSNNLNISDKFQKKWFILLPLFKEQKIVSETISYLLNVNCNKNTFLVIVTSSKEIGLESTFNIVEREISNQTWGDETNRILLFQEQNLKSSMASQLNFAINKLIIQNPKNISNYYVLYNADSRPSNNTFNYFNKIIDFNQSHSGFAMQQPCIFVKNIDNNSNMFTNALSIYQTWFCLGHEMRILRRYEKKVTNINKKRSCISELFNSPLGYCVGHGSAMRFDTLIKEGGYPEHFLTEDLTLGYFLSAHQIPIYISYVPEIGDVPMNLKTYVKQSSVWYWNYIGYIGCFFDKKVSSVPISRRLALLIIGISRGLYWLFLSPFYILPIFLGIIFMNSQILLMGILGICIFQLLPITYLLYILPSCLLSQNFFIYSKRIKNISKINTGLVIILVIFIDSIGPWFAVIQSLFYLSQGKYPTKYKTER